MQTGMSQTEVLGFATELYASVHAVARRYGMTFDQVVNILVRTQHPESNAYSHLTISRPQSSKAKPDSVRR